MEGAMQEQLSFWKTLSVALALIAAIAVYAMLEAKDAEIAQLAAKCDRDRQNAQRYSTLLAHVLNGGAISAPGTLVSCKAKQLGAS
jgi:hypothetical protein